MAPQDRSASIHLSINYTEGGEEHSNHDYTSLRTARPAWHQFIGQLATNPEVQDFIAILTGPKTFDTYYQDNTKAKAAGATRNA